MSDNSLDVGEQFSLRWNNFHSNLTTGFHDLLEEEDLVDVTLASEGQFVQAHKIVLSVCSPYFKSLFKVNPCKHPIVILKDVSYKDLLSILHFMYRGEVNVRQDELSTFLKTAEMLKIKGLTDENKGQAQPSKTKTATVEREQRVTRVLSESVINDSEDDSSGRPPPKRKRPENRVRSSPPPPPQQILGSHENSSDTVGTESFEMTRPKMEPLDYNSSEDYIDVSPPTHNEENSRSDLSIIPKASSSNHLSIDQTVHHSSSEALATTSSVPVTLPPLLQMDSSVSQMSGGTSLTLPPHPGSVLDTSVSLQAVLKDDPGGGPSTSAATQDHSSQDGSQVTKHDIRTPVPCNFCGKMVRRSNMSRHVLDRHSFCQSVTCSLCGREFRNKHSLGSHMYYSHKKQTAPMAFFVV